MGNLGYPYTPTHPGEGLKEEIEYRGISQKKLSQQMGVSYSMLNEILNAKRPVTETLALCFEAALDVEAEMLINMQMRYNMQAARKDSNLKARLSEIRKYAAILSFNPLTTRLNYASTLCPRVCSVVGSGG